MKINPFIFLKKQGAVLMGKTDIFELIKIELFTEKINRILLEY